MNNNIIRRISELSVARNRRAIARATTPFKSHTRKTMPIGLAVTRVGAPVAQVPRRTVSRSRTHAKTPKLTATSTDMIDRFAPQAYKNNTWKYYTSLSRNKVIFFNSKTGLPFTFTKEGRRINVPMSYFQRVGFPFEGIRRNARLRKKTYHTFDAYQKRLNKEIRTVRGQPQRNVAHMNVATKVQRYLNGYENALNDVPFSRLMWWASRVPWMGHHYTKYAGKWRRIGNPVPVTRQNLLNNIRLMWNINQNL